MERPHFFRTDGAFDTAATCKHRFSYIRWRRRQKIEEIMRGVFLGQLHLVRVGKMKSHQAKCPQDIHYGDLELRPRSLDIHGAAFLVHPSDGLTTEIAHSEDMHFSDHVHADD